MLKNKKYLHLLISVCFLFGIIYTSCQTETKTTYEDRLTGQIWKLDDYQIEENPVVSIYLSLDTCYKDNTYRFFFDGTFTTYEGSRKCVPNDPNEQRGTWSFSEDKKFLITTNFKGERTTLGVVLMEKEMMKLRYVDSSSINYLQIYKPVN